MPLKLVTRGRIYHVQGTINGRRIRKSTRTTDKRIAERVKTEFENVAWRDHLDGPGAQVTFAQAVNAYLEAGKPERFLLRILDYWKDTPLRQITGEAVR